MVAFLQYIVKNEAMKKFVALADNGQHVLILAGSDPVEIYGWRVFALGM
jgi:hypothetical protein